MIPPAGCKYCWEDGLNWARVVGVWFDIVGWGNKTDWYECVVGAASGCAGIKTFESDTGNEFSGFDNDWMGMDAFEFDSVGAFVN